MDRNQSAKPAEQAKALSLSARRAWIEIDVIRPAIDVFLAGRSPQGERG